MTDYDALEEELSQSKLTRETLARLWRFMSKYKKTFLTAITLEGFWVMTVAYVPPKLIQKGIDDCILANNFKLLLILTGVYFLNLILKWILNVNVLKLTWKAAQLTLQDIRVAVFEHIQNLSMKYFDRTKKGKIIARADRDVESLEHIAGWGPLVIFSSFATMLLTVIIMISYNWKLTAIVSTVSPIIIISSRIFQKKAMKAYRLLRRRLSRITANVAENVSGIQVVKAFCRERLNLKRFDDLSMDFTNVAIRASLVWFVYFPILGFMYAVATVIILIFGGKMIHAGTLTIGELGAFILLLRYFFGPIEWLGHIYNESLHGAAAAERIFDLLDTKPEVVDKENAVDMTVKNGNVEFSKVSFSYNPGKDDGDVLHSINFNVESGQKLAVVGKTGAGKTSIVNLLIKFYEPQNGKILIDSYNVADVTTKSLRSNMAVVPQDNFLFTGTVMENLTYIEKKVEPQQVIEAAKKLGSHEVIMKLSDGYETQVKERGAGLSLGERQLICFTRALLSDPEILILDEATSAVDSYTENKLQHALIELTEGRTSIIIAHRLSTIKKADKILVVDNGKIVETGKHKELISNGGVYSNLYKEYLKTG